MNFNSKQYWIDRYKNGGFSGAGSRGDEANHKADLVNYWITMLNIKTIQDYGVGDAYQVSLLTGYSFYTGYDISQECVDKCSLLPNSGIMYFTTDINEIDNDADLALSLDVIFHLVEDDVYHQYLKMLFENKHKYVIIYGYSKDDNQGMAVHMKMRDFLKDIAELYKDFELISTTQGYDTEKVLAVYKK